MKFYVWDECGMEVSEYETPDALADVCSNSKRLLIASQAWLVDLDEPVDCGNDLAFSAKGGCTRMTGRFGRDKLYAIYQGVDAKEHAQADLDHFADCLDGDLSLPTGWTKL